MSNASGQLGDELRGYLLSVGVREPEVAARLRERTAELPEHNMQIAPEQGALMSMLIKLTGAKRVIEVGTFTGYSALIMALALPADGSIVCCDVSSEWTGIGKQFWAEAGVDSKIDLQIGPAVNTLDTMINSGAAESFDFAFVDADKASYPAYYERLYTLIRPGGVILFDNVFWGGKALDADSDNPDTIGIRQINATLAADDRIDVSMIPIADGLTIARKRSS